MWTASDPASARGTACRTGLPGVGQLALLAHTSWRPGSGRGMSCQAGRALLGWAGAVLSEAFTGRGLSHVEGIRANQVGHSREASQHCHGVLQAHYLKGQTKQGRTRGTSGLPQARAGGADQTPGHEVACTWRRRRRPALSRLPTHGPAGGVTLVLT